MAEFSEAIDYFVDESRAWIDQNDQAAIVVHCTASANPGQTDTQLGDYFRTNAARVSTHYGIDRTGACAQYVLEKDGAAGNGILEAGYDPFWNQYSDNPNWHSLSVECENDVNNGLPLADPQEATLFRLLAYWVKKYDIPIDNIKGHFSLQPVNRVHCPGLQFPWAKMKTYLSGNQPQPEETIMIDLTNATVASHFAGTDNTMWTCKDNGFLVGHAILDFYRKFGGYALCGLTYLGLPVSNELPVHGLPVVVEQEYERATVRYDPSHLKDNPPGSSSVYLIHEDQDPRWIAAQAQIATLQAEIAALQSLPAAARLLQINALAAQIVKLSAVQ